jgi:hypothetical protein
MQLQRADQLLCQAARCLPRPRRLSPAPRHPRAGAGFHPTYRRSVEAVHARARRLLRDDVERPVTRVDEQRLRIVRAVRIGQHLRRDRRERATSTGSSRCSASRPGRTCRPARRRPDPMLRRGRRWTRQAARGRRAFGSGSLPAGPPLAHDRDTPRRARRRLEVPLPLRRHVRHSPLRLPRPHSPGSVLPVRDGRLWHAAGDGPGVT